MEVSFIIFDGYCNLCNGAVDFIIRRDARGRFCYVANQSEAGQALLTRLGEDPSDVQTFFLYENGKLFKRSSAALKVAAKLPFPWWLAGAGWIIPRILRDAIYNWVAHNRYHWFGKRDSCRLPSPEEREFLIEDLEALNQKLSPAYRIAE